MWNIMIKAGMEFEIEEWIGRKLVSLGICMEKIAHDQKVAERAKRKAEEAANVKAVVEIKSDIPIESKPEKKPRKLIKE